MGPGWLLVINGVMGPLANGLMNGCITTIRGVITLLITDRGPLCNFLPFVFSTMVLVERCRTIMAMVMLVKGDGFSFKYEDFGVLPLVFLGGYFYRGDLEEILLLYT